MYVFNFGSKGQLSRSIRRSQFAVRSIHFTNPAIRIVKGVNSDITFGEDAIPSSNINENEPGYIPLSQDESKSTTQDVECKDIHKITIPDGDYSLVDLVGTINEVYRSETDNKDAAPLSPYNYLIGRIVLNGNYRILSCDTGCMSYTLGFSYDATSTYSSEKRHAFISPMNVYEKKISFPHYHMAKEELRQLSYWSSQMQWMRMETGGTVFVTYNDETVAHVILGAPGLKSVHLITKKVNNSRGGKNVFRLIQNGVLFHGRDYEEKKCVIALI